MGDAEDDDEHLERDAGVGDQQQEDHRPEDTRMTRPISLDRQSGGTLAKGAKL
jgi:hypothetical protein